METNKRESLRTAPLNINQLCSCVKCTIILIRNLKNYEIDFKNNIM